MRYSIQNHGPDIVQQQKILICEERSAQVAVSRDGCGESVRYLRFQSSYVVDIEQPVLFEQELELAEV